MGTNGLNSRSLARRIAVMPVFNEAKATQAAARLLQRGSGRMNYMKLIKLLYLVDREALLRWGRPVSTDRYVSMDRGLVLSKLHDLITEGVQPGISASPFTPKKVVTFCRRVCQTHLLNTSSTDRPRMVKPS